MTVDLLRYDQIVERALRGVVKTALEQVRDYGLPHGHSLYITFQSDHPDVVLPGHLKVQYPREMTIVLEHQFWDLYVEDDRFEVTLSFSRVRQHLVIPFEAVTAFADPGVQFGLKFDVEGGPGTLPPDGEPPNGEDHEPASNAPAEGAEVVTLDTFRKK
ncbi:MAG: SspB family protein [Candidatus Eiseniibacteriota bacterium]